MENYSQEGRPEFIADALFAAHKNADAMRGLNCSTQIDLILTNLRNHDSAVVLYPLAGRAGGYECIIIQGAEYLAGAGVSMADISGGGDIVTPRRLPRPVRTTAYLVASAQEARYFQIAYGDDTGSRRIRRQEERKDGPRAVRNMRSAATPAGMQELREYDARMARAH